MDALAYQLKILFSSVAPLCGLPGYILLSSCLEYYAAMRLKNYYTKF